MLSIGTLCDVPYTSKRNENIKDQHKQMSSASNKTLSSFLKEVFEALQSNNSSTLFNISVY